MADITGTFELVSTEGFEKYLEAIGVGFLRRKELNSTNARMEIIKSGDQYTLRIADKVRTTEIEFKLGQEFKELTVDGRDVYSTFTLEGNTLRQVQRVLDKDLVSTKIDREISPEGVNVSITYGNITASRKYRRI